MRDLDVPPDERQAGGGYERRKSERAPVVVRVDYATVDRFFSDFTRDINEGGMFVETREPLPPGTEVGLQFRLPGSEAPLDLRGTVVHVRETPSRGMGIEFGALDAEARATINAVVRKLRTRA